MSKMAEIHANIQKYEDAGFIAKPQMSFTYKDVYGQRLYYPACAKSQLMCDLMRRKTFTECMFPDMEALGFDVKVTSQSIR